MNRPLCSTILLQCHSVDPGPFLCSVHGSCAGSRARNGKSCGMTGRILQVQAEIFTFGYIWNRPMRVGKWVTKSAGENCVGRRFLGRWPAQDFWEGPCSPTPPKLDRQSKTLAVFFVVSNHKKPPRCIQGANAPPLPGGDSSSCRLSGAPPPTECVLLLPIDRNPALSC